MNWDRIEGNWRQFKGAARQQWGEFTGNGAKQFTGERERLSGQLQERYGIAKEEARRQLKDFRKRSRNGNPAKPS